MRFSAVTGLHFLSIVAIAGAAGLGASASGCSSSDAPAPSPTDNGSTTAAPSAPAGHVRLARGAHPLARPELDRGAVDRERQITHLSIVFKPTAAQLRDRDALVAALTDPASPSFRQWLTPEQYAARFGATDATISKTTAWLASHGLEVHGASRLGTRLNFSGKVRDLESAFKASFRQYQVGNELHYALSEAPAVPSELSDVILAVHNTHDFFARPVGLKGSGAKIIPDTTIGSTKGLAPPDWASVYDVNPLYTNGVSGAPIDGSGVTIAIVGIADVAQSDINAYRTRFNLPASTVTKTIVPNTGAPNGNSGGAGVEAMLDLEWSGGIAPKATINYVYTGASDGNVDDATYYAIEQNIAPILSESWGGCEYGMSQSDQDVIAIYGSAANLLGITYLASSGDSGAASCTGFGYKGLYVNVPASYPGVTAVGGTQFGSLSFGASGVATGWSSSETVWNESTSSGPSAGGGGISIVFNRPSYQSALATCSIVGSLPAQPNGSMRQVPDISMSAAGGHYPYFVGCTLNAAQDDCSASGGSPQYFGVGGTSASAPSFAGVVALMNQATGTRLGNINPMLYALETSTPTAFHDITTGNNEVACASGDPGCPAGLKYGFAASAGYDCATGIGSIDANLLVNAVAKLARTTTALAASPTTTSEGANVNLTATLKVPTPNASTLGGVVTFTFETYDANGKPDLSWTLGTGNVGSATTSAGTATLSTSLPPGLVKPGQQYVDVVAMYGGDARHLPSTSAKVRVTVNALNFAIAPATSTVASGASIQFTQSGGITPLRWFTSADTTCDANYKCSTINEQTGAFVAGPVAGSVNIFALDKDGVEALASVTVTAPVADAGVDAAAPDAAAPDAGVADASAPDASAQPDASTPDDASAPADASSGADASSPRDSGSVAQDDSGSASDSGSDDGGSSNGATSSDNSGCGCKVAGESSPVNGAFGGAFAFAGLAVLGLRRRRSAKRGA